MGHIIIGADFQTFAVKRDRLRNILFRLSFFKVVAKGAVAVASLLLLFLSGDDQLPNVPPLARDLLLLEADLLLPVADDF